MNHLKLIKYKNYSWFLVGAVLLVILAGGTVRMTQSGMGCPDWPRCFGMWIPPINESQLPPDFESYLKKQDIDHSFNVYHTWIEYINRLLGALLGVFVFIYLIWSFRIRKYTGMICLVSAIALFLLTGFQGWLGKLVVDDNLAVSKITIHMLVAIILLCIPLINIRSLDSQKIKVRSLLKWIPVLLIVVVLIQVVLGTQVREEIDIISKSLSYQQRELWIPALPTVFIIHRSFSWLIIVVMGVMFYKFKDKQKTKKDVISIALLALVNMLLGIIMVYLDMPALAQPLHLIGACLLVAVIFNFYLKLQSCTDA